MINSNNVQSVLPEVPVHIDISLLSFTFIP